MDGGRRRSASFHEDPDAPPLPDFSNSDAPPLPDFSAMAEGDSAADEEEPDFDNMVRCRSRSKSLHDSEEDISNMIVANAHVHPITPSAPAADLELAGPIKDREAIALKKVSTCSYTSHE